MFDKLAHASIMRLNANSMDKLYDLMTMAVKYQVGHFDLKKKKKFAGAHVSQPSPPGLADSEPPRRHPWLRHRRLRQGDPPQVVMWTSWVLFQANVELAFQHTVNNYGSMHIAELQSVRLSPSYGKHVTATSLQSEFILQKTEKRRVR